MQSKIREDIHDDDNDGFDYDSIYCNFDDNNDKKKNIQYHLPS